MAPDADEPAPRPARPTPPQRSTPPAGSKPDAAARPARPTEPPRSRPTPPPPPTPPADDLYDLAPEPEVPEPSTFRPTPARKPNPAPGRPAATPPPQGSKPGAEAKRRPRPAPAGADELDDDEPSQPRRRPSRSEESEPAGGPGRLERLVFGKVTPGLMADFCRRFATYLDAGVGLNKVMGSLQKQFGKTAMGPVVERLGQAVAQGDSLSDAAARERQAFDPMFLSMLRVAEARGGLPEVLRNLAEHYASRQRLIRQARSAMIYPTAVIGISLLVGGLLTVFVLPKLVDILRDMTRGRSIDLPLPTRMLMGLSDFIQAYGWWLIPLTVVGGGFALIRWYGTDSGKAVLDRLIMRVPVMGKLLRMIDTARFARTLSDLLDAGVDINTSLRLTADTLYLVPYRDGVRAVDFEVADGSELSPALADSGLFAQDLVTFVETGEDTGNLPESLGRSARDYEERVEHMVKNLGSLIQPLIFIVLGAIVGFIVIAFIMAYIAVIANLASGL